MKPLKICFSKRLTDYITSLAWSKVSHSPKTLAVSSASGEVKLWQEKDELIILQGVKGKSIDSLDISPDGRYLAAGGQEGKVYIWYLPTQELIQTLDNGSAWIDRLSWHPQANILAFGVDRRIDIWDARERSIVARLDFADSSIFSLAWHPRALLLAAAGYRGVKVWQGDNWQEEPTIFAFPTASIAIAWSPDGKYLACGNANNTLVINEWGNENPWVMQGFPGKVRTLTWSPIDSVSGAPLIAVSSMEGIIVWEKQQEDEGNWDAWVLEGHLETINSIAFQPHSFNLASAGNDGNICLWRNAEQIAQIIDGAKIGFSTLAWHPEGELLAAGGTYGELSIFGN